MEYSNTDILDCLRANLLAVSYVTSCVPFLRGHASEKKSSMIFICQSDHHDESIQTFFRDIIIKVRLR